MARIVKLPYEVWLFHQKDSKNYAVVFGACTQFKPILDDVEKGDTVTRISSHRTLEAARKKAYIMRQDVLYSDSRIDDC